MNTGPEVPPSFSFMNEWLKMTARRRKMTKVQGLQELIIAVQFCMGATLSKGGTRKAEHPNRISEDAPNGGHCSAIDCNLGLVQRWSHPNQALAPQNPRFWAMLTIWRKKKAARAAPQHQVTGHCVATVRD